MLPLLVIIYTHYTLALDAASPCHDTQTHVHLSWSTHPHTFWVFLSLLHIRAYTRTHNQDTYASPKEKFVWWETFVALIDICPFILRMHVCALVLSRSPADQFSLPLFLFLSFSHTNMEQSTKKGPYCRRTPFTPQKVKIPTTPDDNHTLSPSERRTRQPHISVRQKRKIMYKHLESLYMIFSITMYMRNNELLPSYTEWCANKKAE